MLGQKDFCSNEPGVGPDRLNWPIGVATDGKHLVVADTCNNRVLIWEDFPTEDGEPADLVLGAPDPYTRISGPLPGREDKTKIFWPWDVWTDGERLIVTKEVAHFIHPEKYRRMAHSAHFIEYCDEELKGKLLERLMKRKGDPAWGEFDYDVPGRLAGNWFLKGISGSDPLGEWHKHLAFVYYMFDRSQIRIAIGGTLPVEVSYEGYAVVGNSPDPADVTAETGKVVYWLTSPPEMGVEKLPDVTLLVQMLDDETIKVEAFQGHLSNPEFTEKALIYTR